MQRNLAKEKIVLISTLKCKIDLKHINALHDLSDDYVRVLVVGHNPGLEELVEMLTGEIHIMPTCSLAHVKLNVDSWLDIDYETKGKLVDMWQPGA